MSEIQSKPLSKNLGINSVGLARAAFEDFLCRDLRTTVGRVHEDLFYHKIGVFVHLAECRTGRFRGSSAEVQANTHLYDGIIDTTLHAATEGAIGPKLTKKDVDNTRITLGLIDEVYTTTSPVEELEQDKSLIPIVDNSYLLPTIAQQYEWTAEEYLSRTYRKAQYNPRHWCDEPHVTLCKTRMFQESEGGSPVEVRLTK